MDTGEFPLIFHYLIITCINLSSVFGLLVLSCPSLLGCTSLTIHSYIAILACFVFLCYTVFNWLYLAQLSLVIVFWPHQNYITILALFNPDLILPSIFHPTLFQSFQAKPNQSCLTQMLFFSDCSYSSVFISSSCLNLCLLMPILIIPHDAGKQFALSL